MADLIITRKDDVYLQIKAHRSIIFDLHEDFSYYADDYKHMPKYKSGIWDGKIRLISLSSQTMYYGLLPNIIKWCNDNNYTYEIDKKSFTDARYNIPKEWVEDFISKIPTFLKEEYTPYDYQLDAVRKSLLLNRGIILSPTGSGKSLIIYLILKFLIDYLEYPKMLIIVPTIGLVGQLINDFNDYDKDENFVKKCHGLYGGQAKNISLPILVSTWQSIYKLDKDWFSMYNVCLVDEVHGATATSIKGILEKMPSCPFKIGLTGTLKDTTAPTIILKGLFGSTITTKTTAELQEMGILTKLNIDVVVLNYSKEILSTLPNKRTYADEVKFLITNPQRNEYIVNQLSTLKGNTLILYAIINHGKELERLIKEKYPHKKLFRVYGGTDVEQRQAVRKFSEENDDVVIVAGYQVFATGVNIKNLHNAIFAHPYKAKIKVLQSIGRLLRKNANKTNSTLIDIADLLTEKKNPNIVFEHAVERIKIYERSDFTYKIRKDTIQ